jgi:hypothetical protein
MASDGYACACGRHFDRQVEYAGHRFHCDAEPEDERDPDTISFDVSLGGSSMDRARDQPLEVTPLADGAWLVAFERGDAHHEVELAETTAGWEGDCWTLDDEGRQVGRCRGWVYNPGPCAHLWAVRSWIAGQRLAGRPEDPGRAAADHHDRVPSEVEHNGLEVRFDSNESVTHLESVSHREGNGFFIRGTTPPRGRCERGFTRERMSRSDRPGTGRAGAREAGFFGGGRGV